MNFLPGFLTRENGIIFRSSSDVGVKLMLPSAFSPADSLFDRPLILGIRPEHLVMGDSAADGFASTALVVEKLGNETLLYCQVADEQLTVRIEGDPKVVVDQKIHFQLQAEHIRLFDDQGAGLNLMI